MGQNSQVSRASLRFLAYPFALGGKYDNIRNEFPGLPESIYGLSECRTSNLS
jgi:hypothetical protein